MAELAKDTSTLVEVKLSENKNKKSILKNVTNRDFIIKSRWDTRKVTKNFIKNLHNISKVDKHYLIGEFVIKSGETRKLKKCNLNELLDRLPVNGYSTIVKKDTTRMYITK